MFIRVIIIFVLLLSLNTIGCSDKSGTQTPQPDPPGNGSETDDENEEPSELPTPDIYDELKEAGSIWQVQEKSPGSVSFISDPGANDGYAAKITLQGSSALSYDDYAGPGFSNHLATTSKLSYGRFEGRFKAAPCGKSGEEVITGFFTYAYGGDENGNGITDNDEIDIEVACSYPEIIWLTIWTDYEDGKGFRKVTRKINTVTGNYYQTESGKENTYSIGHEPIGKIEELAEAEIDLFSDYQVMGFEWAQDSVRYFIKLGDEEITLWNYSDAVYTPKAPATFLINVWHSDGMWSADENGDYPSADASAYLDWFKYWAD